MRRVSILLPLLVFLALAGCVGDVTPESKIKDQCELDYPNSPVARDNCVRNKEAEFLACRDAEKAQGVDFQDTKCI